jgi:hypothetical protein
LVASYWCDTFWKRNVQKFHFAFFHFVPIHYAPAKLDCTPPLQSNTSLIAPPRRLNGVLDCSECLAAWRIRTGGWVQREGGPWCFRLIWEPYIITEMMCLPMIHTCRCRSVTVDSVVKCSPHNPEIAGSIPRKCKHCTFCSLQVRKYSCFLWWAARAAARTTDNGLLQYLSA